MLEITLGISEPRRVNNAVFSIFFYAAKESLLESGIISLRMQALASFEVLCLTNKMVAHCAFPMSSFAKHDYVENVQV